MRVECLEIASFEQTGLCDGLCKMRQMFLEIILQSNIFVDLRFEDNRIWLKYNEKKFPPLEVYEKLAYLQTRYYYHFC